MVVSCQNVKIYVCCRKDEAQQKIEMLKLSIGETPRKRKRGYEAIDNKLCNLATTWGSRSPLEYLLVVARNLRC